MNNVDSSGLQTIENLINNLQKMDIKVYITSMRTKVTEKFHYT
jgi:anti-anti-sigma regulatory factor